MDIIMRRTPWSYWSRSATMLRAYSSPLQVPAVTVVEYVIVPLATIRNSSPLLLPSAARDKALTEALEVAPALSV
jgi:hypothetical protein